MSLPLEIAGRPGGELAAVWHCPRRPPRARRSPGSAQVIVNGHDYVAIAAQAAGIRSSKPCRIAWWAPPMPEPTAAGVRAWAGVHGIPVPDRGQLRRRAWES